MLEGFSEAALDISLREAQDEMDRRLVQQLKQAKSWSRVVGENLVANLLAIAVTTLLVVIVYASRVGVAKLLADTFGYEIREKPATTESGQLR